MSTEKPHEVYVATEKGRVRYKLQSDGFYAIDPRTLPGNPKVKLVSRKIELKNVKVPRWLTPHLTEIARG